MAQAARGETELFELHLAASVLSRQLTQTPQNPTAPAQLLKLCHAARIQGRLAREDQLLNQGVEPLPRRRRHFINFLGDESNDRVPGPAADCPAQLIHAGAVAEPAAADAAHGSPGAAAGASAGGQQQQQQQEQHGSESRAASRAWTLAVCAAQIRHCTADGRAPAHCTLPQLLPLPHPAVFTVRLRPGSEGSASVDGVEAAHPSYSSTPASLSLTHSPAVVPGCHWQILRFHLRALFLLVGLVRSEGACADYAR